MFPMKPRVRPDTNAITPIHAVIASSRLMAVAFSRDPTPTRNFQLGIDHTQTRFASRLSISSATAIDRTTPPGVAKPGLVPNTVMTTKLPVISDENQVWNALRSRSHSIIWGRVTSSTIARSSFLTSDICATSLWWVYLRSSTALEQQVEEARNADVASPAPRAYYARP